jgi:hypothetical protein
MAQAHRERRRSPAFCLTQPWEGPTLSFYTYWPTSFCITVLFGMVFFGAAAARRYAG